MWPLVSPRGFYDTFPGGGMHWIDVNGPYNEHFIRDFGALNAAVAVLVVFALWKPSKALLQATGLALAVYALPHAIFHVQNIDVYESDEKLIAVVPLMLQFVGGVLIAWLARDTVPAHSPGAADS